MKRPFVFMVIPFILGIVFAYKFEVRTNILVMLLIIFIILCIVSIAFRKGYKLILFLICSVVGSLLYISSVSNSLDEFLGHNLSVECKIKKNINSNEDYSTYIANAFMINMNGQSYFSDENIILRVYEGEILNIGDTVKVQGILNKPNVNTNPGLFNYRLYLQTQGIFCTMTTNGYNLKIKSMGELTRGQVMAYRFRDYVISTLNNSLSPKNSNIMKSIVLGDDSFLDEYTEEKFRSLGIAHILAVSGLHIGIIFACITFILRLLKVDKRISVIISILLIWIYGYFISFPSSVLRASIMFSILILSTLTYRRYDSLNILAFSALILLVYRPSFVFGMGFQFSFLATVSLIVFTNRIKNLIYNESNKYRRISKTIPPLIAVQLGMLPVTGYYFNSYCIFSILSNLLIIPILSLSLIMSFVLLLISLISLRTGVAVGFFIDALINISSWITDIIYNVPILNISMRSMSIWEIAAYYLLLLMVLKIIRLDFLTFNIAKLISVYLAVAVFLSIIAVFIEDNMTIDFIDVGQGDCSLIRTKDKSILIDSGGNILSDFDVGSNIVLPYLRKQGVRKIDAVFISHFHEDHCEGLLSLIGKIKMKYIFIGYNPSDNKLYDAIRCASEEYDIEMITVNKSDVIKLDKNIAIRILSPVDSKENILLYDDNNLSTVMILEALNKKILFTGDIEKEVEIDLAKGNKNHDINVLKVPHHGSNTSSTNTFIHSFNPDYAVIQVGKNTFGHPSQEVLDRYLENNVKVYRNDENGMITIELHRNSLKISAYLQDKQNLHDIIIKYKLEIASVLFFMSAACFLLKKVQIYYYWDLKEYTLKLIHDEVTK